MSRDIGSGQDWAPVVFGKKGGGGGGGNTQAARAAGAGQTNGLKFGAGSNRQHGTHLNTKILDEDHENTKHKTVSSNMKKQILEARLAKGWTQAQLGQQINEKPQIIQQYESGKAIPNPQVINKLSRVLGVQLRK